eukprot:936443-Pelagomonas_calceolata.AAC.6
MLAATLFPFDALSPQNRVVDGHFVLDALCPNSRLFEGQESNGCQPCLEGLIQGPAEDAPAGRASGSC